jgi:hypothetical protein
VKGADREDSNVSIDRLSYHPGIQKMCEQLEHAGFNCLRSPSLHGMGLAAKIDMPEHRELSHYIGLSYMSTLQPIIQL